MRTSYETLVHAYRELLQTAVGDTTAITQQDRTPAPREDAPVCLVFSPHPDDESLCGGLPLRLRQQSGWRVINVAVTLGSRIDRRAARWAELQNSCQCLGFELVAGGRTPAQGLEGVNTDEAQANTPRWRDSVLRISQLLAHYQPRAVVCPHPQDGHPAHIGTSLLVTQALQASPQLSTHQLLSEYWNTQLTPRLMVELGDSEVARLMHATAQHVGEVSRNPYHLSLPAWLIDSARRGAERVGGQGAAASTSAFAALYGWHYWQQGQPLEMPPLVLRPEDNPGQRLDEAVVEWFDPPQKNSYIES